MEPKSGFPIEKSVKCKEIIKKHATNFGGMLRDTQVMVLCKIARNAYDKHKREWKAQSAEYPYRLSMQLPVYQRLYAPNAR